MDKQLDVFGNESEFVEPPSSNRTKTMQEMFGVVEGKCKDCIHCYRRQMANTWYKCEIWDHYFYGSSASSDIHLKNQACGKFEKNMNKEKNDVGSEV